MRHWTPILLAAAGLALFPLPAQAETSYMDFLADEIGVLDKAGSKKLLSVLGDTEVLVGETEDSIAHLEQVATFSAQRFYLTGIPQLDGMMAAQLDRRPEFPASATFSLLFADFALRDRFYAGLKTIHGEPDPACLNDTNANWSEEPGRSIAWRAMDAELPMVDLTITASDPSDANCARSASPHSHLLSEDDVAAFLTRLRDEPPPFSDPKAFQGWLAPYGSMDISGTDECYASALLPAAEQGGEAITNLGGINFLMANLDTCSDGNGGLSYMSLSSFVDVDMFSLDKFVQTAEAILGQPIESCSDGYMSAWIIDDDNTLMVSDSYLSVMAMIYNASPSMLGCDLPGS